MYAIVLRRRNGRFVKRLESFRSKYAAKQRFAYWRDKYDGAYDVVIEREKVTLCGS